MPRKAMQFSESDAKRICLDMRFRMQATDSDWRERNLAFPESATTWSQRYAFMKEALAAIENVYTLIKDTGGAPAHHPGADVASNLRIWLHTYLAPTGWERYLAAARQRKFKKLVDSKQTTLDSWTSYRIGKLANEVQLHKKVLLGQLMEFFASPSGPGLAAKQNFCDFLLAGPRTNRDAR